MRELLLILLTLGLTSCSYFSTKEDKPIDTFENSLTKYKDNPNYGVWGQRNYKKTSRAQLEAESELDSKAGSLWVMDGQQSYYFSQNKNRKEGDFLNVKLEGAALKQVETKIGFK